jgi:hypothetical protein
MLSERLKIRMTVYKEHQNVGRANGFCTPFPMVGGLSRITVTDVGLSWVGAWDLLFHGKGRHLGFVVSWKGRRLELVL